MKVANASAGKFIHLFAPVSYPALITQLAVSVGRYRLDTCLPGSIVSGFLVKSHFTLAIEKTVEELPVVITGTHLLAVDGNQIVADRHANPILVSGTIFVDMCNAVQPGSAVRLQF